jgi:hypothetical protein
MPTTSAMSLEEDCEPDLEAVRVGSNVAFYVFPKGIN